MYRAGNTGLYVNSAEAEFMGFKQNGSRKTLKLEDQITDLGSNITSTYRKGMNYY